MDFIDRTVLVTGSNRGIGRALVSRVLQEDVARVYAAAKQLFEIWRADYAKLEAVVAQLYEDSK